MTCVSRLLLVLALALTPAAAQADDNHYQNFLIGERATGLGGAFTAISDDSSGAFYNPAGLAEAPYSSLSLSASVYGYARQSYALDGALSLTSDNRDFVSYPTTAAWIQQVRKADDDSGAGRVQMALSIVTPQADVLRKRIYMDLPAQATDKAGTTEATEVLAVQNAEDDTLWIGLSVAWKPVRWLALGLTIYGTLRSGQYQLHTHALVTEADAMGPTDRWGAASRYDIAFSHYGLLGVLGLQAKLTDHLRLGLSLRSPQLPLHGAATINYVGAGVTDAGTSTILTIDLEDAVFRDRQPLKATVGAAYVVPRFWGVSVDFSIYGPVGEYAIFEDDDTPDLAQNLRMKKRVVWQINAGAEYYIAGRVPLRAGFFTNRSSLAEFDTCDGGVCAQHGNLLTDGVDLYGGSGSVGWETARTTLTLGVSYCVGSITEDLGDGLTQETTRSYLLVALGGSFRF